jgi:predicted ester cyclase
MVRLELTSQQAFEAIFGLAWQSITYPQSKVLRELVEKRREASMSITTTAKDFFAACETGKGSQVCNAYCTPNATFAAQSEPLAGVKTLAEYTDWMKGLLTIMPDGSYDLKSFATDTERNNVAAYAVFSGTHTGPGGPCEPTGKKTTSDYVYVMQFTGDKISHMTKIWHSGMALKEQGWA